MQGKSRVQKLTCQCLRTEVPGELIEGGKYFFHVGAETGELFKRGVKYGGC